VDTPEENCAVSRKLRFKAEKFDEVGVDIMSNIYGHFVNNAMTYV